MPPRDDVPLTPNTTRTGLGRTAWIAPPAVAVVAVGLCWWLYAVVNGQLAQRIAADLGALADAQAAAVARALGDADRAEALAKIAEAGRPGLTGETLIFDDDARLLAPSRYEAALRETGAFPATLGLDLRDPGGELSSGFRPELARRSLPLTKMAGAATSGSSGADVRGYRSYRGVLVVGAWRWLPEAHVGVAVEMEAAEAYGPTSVLLHAVWAFGALALAAAAGGLVVATRSAALMRKVRDADSKVRTLGQYTLIRRIGEGGGGEVFLAQHAMLRRVTAVKLLRPDGTGRQAIARFEREVRHTSRLTHPNTVQIYDFGRTPGGTFYYAMEYLVGVSLDKFVADWGPLEEGRVIYVLLQICGSLNEAHGLGLVHRDVKPANVALCRAGGAYDVAKVLDFGLVRDRERESVKVSASGQMLGTPTYMAPESFAKPDSVDARSDIYSLGGLGYFLLTGKPPFDGATLAELYRQHMMDKPVPPSAVANRAIAPDLEKAILACLEKDPARRPKSANAFARELEWCLAVDDWNRDKARHWWREHEERLEELYQFAAKMRVEPDAGSVTMEIRLEDR